MADSALSPQKPEREFQITTNNRKFTPFQDTEEEQWQGAFTFIQAADTQLGLLERYVERKPNPGWSKEIAWTRQMVADVNRMEPPPKFLVICGDLINAFPTKEQEEDRKNQEYDLKKELKALNIPVVCVCGNHDVGDTPTPETVSKYRSSFGDDYFSFYCGGVYFLVVNSQYWQDRSMTQELAKAHEEWLDKELEAVKAKIPKHVVVFQHIPLFIFSADEPKQYFNLPEETRYDLLRRFKEAGVKYVFCGHFHRNAGGMYGDVEVIVTSAVGVQLGDDVNGFRVVKVTEERIEHKYVGLGTVLTD